MAASRASPVIARLAIDHRAEFGWSPPYRWRISALWAKPPADSRTPWRARTMTGVPSRTVRTPTTRPSSTTSSSTGASVQTGMPSAKATSRTALGDEQGAVGQQVLPPHPGGGGPEGDPGRDGNAPMLRL